MSYSHTTISGNLGRDPEMRKSGSGMAIASFSVAVTLRDVTHWYRCKAFGKTAEFVGRNFIKGRSVIVGGEMRSDSWEDKSGNKRISWELVANTVQPVGPRPDTAPSDNNASTFDDDEEIPF